ncbi:hypothetical protein M5K25_026675 [Dendrobium thyrsiflorum]|uniref:Uncharacterized protein n=1 Tax=Dendrobium thyrsiflorum TaxID=117978 RepID=A0ABD0TY86_DENTH
MPALCIRHLQMMVRNTSLSNVMPEAAPRVGLRAKGRGTSSEIAQSSLWRWLESLGDLGITVRALGRNFKKLEVNEALDGAVGQSSLSLKKASLGQGKLYPSLMMGEGPPELISPTLATTSPHLGWDEGILGAGMFHSFSAPHRADHSFCPSRVPSSYAGLSPTKTPSESIRPALFAFVLASDLLLWLPPPLASFHRRLPVMLYLQAFQSSILMKLLVKLHPFSLAFTPSSSLPLLLFSQYSWNPT